MVECLVSFGANIGDPLATIRAASSALRAALGCVGPEFRLSSPYRTPPVGGPGGQPPFVNAVAAIETRKSVWQVWNSVRQIELEFGRQRNRRWEARKLDLDILLFGEMRLWTPQLKIPHPRMCMRRFILVPATEVASSWLDPVSGQSIGALARRLQQGPASLSLLTTQPRSASLMLQDVTRQALAQWNPHRQSTPDGRAIQNIQAPASRGTRWVELVEVSPSDWMNVEPSLDSQLIVVLAEPMKCEGVAWEDYHADLAARLNLRDRGEIETWNQEQARYLLAGDDPKWAVHEMAAALEAMDCPVESIEA